MKQHFRSWGLAILTLICTACASKPSLVNHTLSIIAYDSDGKDLHREQVRNTLKAPQHTGLAYRPRVGIIKDPEPGLKQYIVDKVCSKYPGARVIVRDHGDQPALYKFFGKDKIDYSNLGVEVTGLSPHQCSA